MSAPWNAVSVFVVLAQLPCRAFVVRDMAFGDDIRPSIHIVEPSEAQSANDRGPFIADGEDNNVEFRLSLTDLKEPLSMDKALNDITELFLSFPRPLQMATAPNFRSLFDKMTSIKSELDRMARSAGDHDFIDLGSVTSRLPSMSRLIDETPRMDHSIQDLKLPASHLIEHHSLSNFGPGLNEVYADEEDPFIPSLPLPMGASMRDASAGIPYSNKPITDREFFQQKINGFKKTLQPGKALSDVALEAIIAQGEEKGAFKEPQKDTQNRRIHRVQTPKVIQFSNGWQSVVGPTAYLVAPFPRAVPPAPSADMLPPPVTRHKKEIFVPFTSRDVGQDPLPNFSSHTVSSSIQVQRKQNKKKRRSRPKSPPRIAHNSLHVDLIPPPPKPPTRHPKLKKHYRHQERKASKPMVFPQNRRQIQGAESQTVVQLKPVTEASSSSSLAMIPSQKFGFDDLVRLSSPVDSVASPPQAMLRSTMSTELKMPNHRLTNASNLTAQTDAGSKADSSLPEPEEANQEPKSEDSSDWFDHIDHGIRTVASKVIPMASGLSFLSTLLSL